MNKKSQDIVDSELDRKMEQAERGIEVEFTPEEAERAGAFVEDALSEQDVLESRRDEEEPCFLDDEGPSAKIPTRITRTNAREMFGMREGETVPEAIARHSAEKAKEAKGT